MSQPKQLTNLKMIFHLLVLLASSPLLSLALKISSSLSTIEYTPELVASQDYYKNDTVTFTNGGVANIVTDTSIDLASNAETQALRQYASHKNLRIIYTVAEVYYRLVANKSKGISTLKDLKGKRIGTFTGTSAAYFVQKYLATAGLKPSDYTVVNSNVCSASPCGQGTLPQMLSSGQVDAIGIWEPSAELAAQSLGTNALIFQDKSVYREIFNLHSTSDKLANAATRKKIVAFLKALNQAKTVFTNTPDSIYARVSTAVGIKVDLLKAVWPVHSFAGSLTGTLPADLLDFMVQEDQWVAQQDRRTAMTGSDLSGLIDPSVLKEAMAS